MQQDTPPPVVSEQIDSIKLSALIAEKKARQNLGAALAAGAVSAIVGGCVWAAVTVATKYQIGWMAIAVGFVVGYAVRYAGKGIDPLYGYIGAGMAFFGCVLGNLLSAVGFVSLQESLPFFQILGQLNVSVSIDILVETFSPMDLLFYGLAIYQGYKFSFVPITEEEVAAVTP